MPHAESSFTLQTALDETRSFVRYASAVGPYLAGAEDDALEVRLLRGVGGAVGGGGVHDQALEAHPLDALVIGDVIKLPQMALGCRVPQQILRREDKQRLAELPVDLAPQQMEVVGWGCAVGNLQKTADVTACPARLTEESHVVCEAL